MIKKNDVGVIGMGIMGRNLALNIESRGYNVAIYNRSKEKIDLIIVNALKKNLFPYPSIKEFIYSLKKPKIVFLMITAGVYVDNIIQILSNYLEKGDILIDGGNSFYKDTIRRNIELSKKEINFIGLGISGGEIGALVGPSLMPGGSKDVYKIIAPILNKIAARVNNEVCVDYIGKNGSGHYVKMIHNGIEYGDIQLIAEIFFFLKHVFCLSYEQLSKVFKEWNQGELNSYLIDITSHIFVKRDNADNYILDSILDIAENKGTGSWASKEALDSGVPLTMITESVFARYLSSLKEQRLQASKIFSVLKKIPKNYSEQEFNIFIEKTRQALYLSKIILYAQGFYQLKIGSDRYHWHLNFCKIAKIFRSGCIIRTQFLQKIIEIYSQDPEVENLLLTPYSVDIIKKYQQSLRDIVIMGINYGMPMPVLASAISYYDGYRCANLPANLIQAQRDCFGAHTYLRTDKKGIFHTNWIHE